jgi:serine/threonine protein kinase
VDLVAGRILGGRFVLDRQLGEGGMGVVWAATHAVTRKVVALKMLKPERAADPIVRQRFVREARAASVVQHPNIIEIRDVIELEDGAPAMVMDLLEGESLGGRLERDPVVPLAELAPIMLQVVSAVGTAHAAGIVHRDLKPDNIFLVDEAGGISVRVLDFGIAKVMATGGGIEVSHGLTNTGAMLGTPFYMAPEQIYGERDIDQRADVWAIGVILYECLAGRRPTEAENIGQILRIITENEIVPLATLVAGLPDDVVSLVERMLRRKRTDRPLWLGEAFEVMSRHAGGATSRAFGEAAVAMTRDSLTSADDSGQRTRIRVSTGGSGHAATQISGTTPVSRPVLSSGASVSPTAATLASTTASTTASTSPDKSRAPPTNRRRVVAIGAVVSLIAAATATAYVVSTRQSPVDTNSSAAVVAPPPSSIAAPPSAAGAPAPVASVAAPSEPAPSASSPAPRGRLPAATAPRPTSTTAPKTAPADSKPKSSQSPYDHM